MNDTASGALARCALALCALTLAEPAQAQEFHVWPYLQLATPDGITVAWETTAGDEARVEWGRAEALGNVTDGISAPLADGQHHIVRLVDLEPATRYFYRVRTGEALSAIADFVTPHAHDDEQPVRLVAMSDMQRDRGAPEIFGEIVDDGVIRYVTERFGDLPGALAMVLIPGDLVDDGRRIDEWRETFFAPGQPLFSRVPVYPVPGNHERDTPYFWQYFVLPDNGTAPWLEHWWFHDRSNLRVIGLDSNPAFQLPEQLEWLDLTLADACADDRIDFVFAQLHHPHLSELWPVGEVDYTGEVIERLEGFSEHCGKPSLHFFGHTHGYSRGQSRDHHHLWVNVASAGGNLDRWGEYVQHDYDEFVVSHDEYGFVLAEVQAGEAPEFQLTRIGRGRPGARVDNAVRDVIRIRRHNGLPQTPTGRFPSFAEPVDPDCFQLAADPFDDPEGDRHQGSHWQISGACDDFEALVFESWRQDQNWYFDVDTQAGDDLTDERVEDFAADAEGCWRVRYRDDSLGWSPWSAPSPFRTGPSRRGENLVHNPGAEDGLDGWDAAEGISEALPADDCQGIAPAAGERYFIVGGLCESSAYAELIQRIDITPLGDRVDASALTAVYSAMMADYNGADRPEMQLRFVDGDGVGLGVSDRIGRNAAGWLRVRGESAIPVGARAIDVVLMGTRNAGEDNDSYIDEVSLTLGEGAGACDEAPPFVEPPDAGDADAGPPDAGPIDAEPEPVEPDMGADAGLEAPDMAAPIEDAAPAGDAARASDAAATADARQPDARPHDVGPVGDGEPDPGGSTADDGCRAAPGLPGGRGHPWPVGVLLVLAATRHRPR